MSPFFATARQKALVCRTVFISSGPLCTLFFSFLPASSLAEKRLYFRTKNHLKNVTVSTCPHHTSSTYSAKVQTRAFHPYSNTIRPSIFTICFSSALPRLESHSMASTSALRAHINMKKVSTSLLLISFNENISNTALARLKQSLC